MIITYESLGPAPVPTLNGVRLDDPIAITDLIESANARAFEAERNTRQMYETLTAAQDLASKTLERARAAEAKLTSKKIDDALADANPSKYLALLQDDHKEWSTRNFPDADPIDAVLGVAEEVGELCHAILKQRQGIRGTKEEHEAKAKDAVGDIVIFLLDVCNRRGWSFAEIVAETWAEVRKRDWTKK